MFARLPRLARHPAPPRERKGLKIISAVRLVVAASVSPPRKRHLIKRSLDLQLRFPRESLPRLPFPAALFGLPRFSRMETEDSQAVLVKTVGPVCWAKTDSVISVLVLNIELVLSSAAEHAA